MGRVVTRRRRAPRVAVMTLVLALVMPATALAGEEVFFEGALGPSGHYGSRHSLSSVWATWSDGRDACLNALNDDGTWAGTTICSTPSDINVGHLYCSCQLRNGFGFGEGNYANAQWREFW
jgi:hypothetical protein